MPWHTERVPSRCPAATPWAVIKDSDNSIEACHPSKEKARRHMAALYANEPTAKAVFEELAVDIARELQADNEGVPAKAVLTAAAREALPLDAFACKEQRKYPHHHEDMTIDIPHLRNALSRVAQKQTTDCGVSHLRRHARIEGIGEFAND